MSKVQELIPVGITGAGSEVHDALVQFMGGPVIQAYRNKTLDIRLGLFAVSIIAAFAEYDKTGDIEAFKKKLERHTL